MSEEKKGLGSKIEWIFEAFLWKTRNLVLLSVISCLLGALLLFIMGTKDIFFAFKSLMESNSDYSYNDNIFIHIVGAVDLFLMGIVLIIFSFGIYELFISRIDIARKDKDIRILDIESLDELKNKFLKVIIMVLIVSFFKTILKIHYETPLEMLYFALAILAVACGGYFMQKKEKEESDNP